MHIRAIDNYLRTTIHRDVLGLSDEKEKRSPHDCRRTYASLEYLNGTDIFVIQRQLGHSTTDQTWDYIRDVVDGTERQSQLKGIGVSILEVVPNTRKNSVYAECTHSINKVKAL